MFKVLGILLGAYTAWAAVSGSVYARHHAWGRSVLRHDQPRYFWVVITIYTALSLALLLWF